MKATVVKDVVEFEKVVEMVQDINDTFERLDMEGLGGSSHPDVQMVFNDVRKEIVGLINSHMNDMDSFNE